VTVSQVDKALVSLDGTVLQSKQPAPMRVSILPEALAYIVPVL
jgi:hypothetical protein